ncbi:MAG: PocR ligand-binding domain-containing protein, partial [Planctomycetota bacterium]
MELVEYLNLETLQQLQDAFTAVAQTPIRICDSDGQPLTSPSVASPESKDRPFRAMLPGGESARTSAPIMVKDQVIGQVRLDSSPGKAPIPEVHPRHLQLIWLVTGVIARLCRREQQLHNRVDELAMRYRLTNEFTRQRNLQSLLDLVAQTVVET